MYAEDLKVAYRYKPADRDAMLDILKNDTEAFAQWCCTWRLSLSWHKGVVMVFGDDHQPQLSIDGHDLNVSGVVKYLNISSSNDLNLSEHRVLIVSKARRTAGFIFRNFKTIDIRLRLYKMYVRPGLEYCSFIFSLSAC
ncbi:unnamed protein product [Schistocephalus solidus]|uniref:Reverse transcriptase domain-containing protein n=1 Tax=Schistocephalus solidus TaxID=70667 RepID=A0A183TIU5_SCHSO|nr:unnamed protein product [Schistocephalus solidus]